MYNSSVLKILKSFSKTELKDLEKFVESPYFNQRQDVVLLYQHIIKHLGKSPTAFEKEKIFTLLYPKKEYDDAALRFTMHCLLKVVKQFLAQKEIDSNNIETQLYLTRAMRRRGFDDFFEKEMAATEQLNTENAYRNADFYYKNYQLTIEKLENITLTRRKGEMPYLHLFDSINKFFIIETLRHRSAALSYQIVAKRTYETPLFEVIIKFLETSNFIEENELNTEGVAIAIYFNVYMALSTRNDNYFQKLKKLIFENWMRFPESESRVMYLQAINFCISKINSNEPHYLGEFFELMQSGLENKRLFENGILSKFTYKNAVTVALKLEKYNWVKQFLEDYKIYLHPKDREVSYNYNLASYYLRLHDFDNALLFLQKIDTSDVLTNFDARSMLVRIYYDNKATEALYSLLDSFSVYINRQKEVNHLKNHYLNLIKYVRQFLKLDIKNEGEKNRLIQEIQDSRQIAEKEWLLEKLK